MVGYIFLTQYFRQPIIRMRITKEDKEALPPQPNSEKRYNKWFGVIKLTLLPGDYRWDFVTFPGVSSDSGNGKCH